jgi:hypothetical protein
MFQIIKRSQFIEIFDTNFVHSYIPKYNQHLDSNPFYMELVDNFIDAYERNNSDVISNLLFLYDDYCTTEYHKLSFLEYLKIEYKHYYDKIEIYLLLR